LANRPPHSYDRRHVLTATVYNVDIDLADQDRGVYETLALRVARHPSESEAFLWTRLLAYALEFTDGIEFSKGGLSDPDEPAIVVRDLTGRIKSWVDVGAPEAARLHKAAKASPRVAVYLHKDPRQMLDRLAGERIHRAGAIELYAFEQGFLGALLPRLERRIAFSLAVAERELYVSIGAETVNGRITRLPLRAATP
jgi:uncharacterized protein YaeQ